MRAGLLVIVIGLLSGCTSIQVQPAKKLSSTSPVCIINNPKVIVSGFIDVIREGFSRHNIPTMIIEESAANTCDVTLTYTALQSWDLALYLSHAELHLWQRGIQIGSAQFHLNGKGGYALTKYKSTKSKMDPVIDQLLSGTT